MRKLALLFILLVLACAARAESMITVEILDSGNANWTMEKHLPLTIPEINEWEATIKAGQNITKYRDIVEFKDMINLFLRSARNFSNRSMQVEELNISYDTAKTLSGGFGVVRYSFQWTNFSNIHKGNIFVGDAFSEGIVLSSDSVLIIEIPDGYDVSASPKFNRREGNRLIWEGATYHSFGRGEPALVLKRASSDQKYAVVLVAIVSCAFIVFWRMKRYNKQASVPQISKESPPYNVENNIMKTSLPDTIEFLGDEEMIEKYLLKQGGQAYQSDIVKDSGLSKSKISIVLSKMKEEGRILKIRKGKENIIRIVKK